MIFVSVTAFRGDRFDIFFGATGMFYKYFYFVNDEHLQYLYYSEIFL